MVKVRWGVQLACYPRAWDADTGNAQSMLADWSNRNGELHVECETMPQYISWKELDSWTPDNLHTHSRTCNSQYTHMRRKMMIYFGCSVFTICWKNLINQVIGHMEACTASAGAVSRL